MKRLENDGSEDLLPALVRWWWVILIGIALGAACGFGATKLVKPKYQATATQLVKGVPGTGSGANFQAAQYSNLRSKDYPALLRNQSVLEAVRNDLGGRVSTEELAKMLTAENQIDSSIVRITAETNDPKLSQDIANATAKQLALCIVQYETVNGISPIMVIPAVQADLPTRPSSPNVVVFAAIGATVGVAAGAAVVALLAYSTRRGSRRRREAESASSSTAGGRSGGPEGKQVGSTTSQSIDSVEEEATAVETPVSVADGATDPVRNFVPEAEQGVTSSFSSAAGVTASAAIPESDDRRTSTEQMSAGSVADRATGPARNFVPEAEQGVTSSFSSAPGATAVPESDNSRTTGNEQTGTGSRSDLADDSVSVGGARSERRMQRSLENPFLGWQNRKPGSE